MKIKNFFCLFNFIALLLFNHLSFAAVDDVILPDVPDGIVKLSTIEPARTSGFTVGDIVTRKITLAVKKPYVLVDTSLPIIGYERRWKGQVIGIDVSAISWTQKEDSNSHTYMIDISYQVLTNNVVAKPASTPTEILQFKRLDSKSNPELLQYKIPGWNFRISPLAVFGAVKIEEDLSGLRGPLILVSTKNELNRKVAAVILGISLLGLLYILGSRAWLPRMGAPFARALRDIRKYENTPKGVKQAISRLHAAFNKTAERSIFKDGINAFIAKNPSFAPLETDISKFFEISRHAFFESGDNSSNQPSLMVWLKSFCRHCRDCERGLIPDINKN